MKHLMLCILALIVFSTALTGGIVAAARSFGAGNPAMLSGFAMCDDQPCYRQIIPGVTRWVEARGVLQRSGRSVAVSWDFQSMMLHTPMGANSIDMMAYPGGVVIWLTYNSSNDHHNFPQLGDFIAEFGPPCLVGPGLAADRIALHYPHLSIELSVTADRLTLVPDINFVNISAVNITPPGAPTNGCEDHTARARWLGFTSLRRYLIAGLSFS